MMIRVDDYPTPPWAARALLTYYFQYSKYNMSVLEPACGRGYISEELKKKFKTVDSSDRYDYGYGSVKNFFDYNCTNTSYDWIITQPPYGDIQKFYQHAKHIATRGVAFLIHTCRLEDTPPIAGNVFLYAPLSKMLMLMDKLEVAWGGFDSGEKSDIHAHMWCIWDFERYRVQSKTTVEWLPSCKGNFEKPEDYIVGEEKEEDVGMTIEEYNKNYPDYAVRHTMGPGYIFLKDVRNEKRICRRVEELIELTLPDPNDEFDTVVYLGDDEFMKYYTNSVKKGNKGY